MRFVMKSVLWIVVGACTIAGGTKLTGFHGSSPWQYTVNATGDVQGQLPVKVTTEDDTVRLVATKVPDVSALVGPPLPGEPGVGVLGAFNTRKTIDGGFLVFGFLVFAAGTITGRLMKRSRPRGFDGGV